MTSARMGVVLGVAVVVALALGAAAGLGAGSRPRPDLVISAVSGPAKSVRIGTRMTVGVTTRNAGRRRAGASTTRLFLARRARRGRGDRRLASVRIVALRAGRSVRRTLRVRVPARSLPGRHRLLVCADAARRVSESRERNNCRAVHGALRVLTSSRGPVGPRGPVTNPTGDDDRDGSMNAVDCAPKDPAINPGAVDRPDVPGFRDTNCDGIDGNASRGVFVSPTGDDASPGTRAEPKRTLGAAVSMALAQAKDVYVTGGVYAERLDVANGVGVYGGYAADWSRSLTAETRITGAHDAFFAEEGALAGNATAPTTLQLLTLAPGVAIGKGGSSYALRAFRSPGLVIEHVTATAGAGRAGMAGAEGADGRSAQAGARGTAGRCDDDTPFGVGGAGGMSPVGRTGGRGGDGAIPATSLADPGAPGLVAGGGGPGGSAGASGNPGHAGGTGRNGQSGPRALDGRGGASGTGSGVVWVSTPGENATRGSDGHGGGGGGGGGAQVGAFVQDGAGNGGGGGGGGGEGGRGGGGGTGGGGSFGIYLYDSTGAVITDSVIRAAEGGAGGAGGAGGRPGQGGAGGLGATYCTGEIGAGGNGGMGGAGGLGGHGGGGAGGPSIALYRIDSTITTSGNTLTFGVGGEGGTGPDAGSRGAAGATEASARR